MSNRSEFMTGSAKMHKSRGSKAILPDEVANGFLENYSIADKAVLALVILAAQRRPKDVGVGPNRDDKVIFTRVAQARVEGTSVPRGPLYQSRFRVRKYARQLRESRFYKELMDPDIALQTFIQYYANIVNQAANVSILATEIEAVMGYGDW